MGMMERVSVVSWSVACEGIGLGYETYDPEVVGICDNDGSCIMYLWMDVCIHLQGGRAQVRDTVS